MHRSPKTDASPAEPRRWAVALLLLAFLLRAGFSLSRPTDDLALVELPDQLEYLNLARSLLAGEGLQLYDARFDQTLLAHRTPGYPLLVAACGADVRVVRVVQAFLATLTVWLTIRIARPLGARGALLAGFIVAVHPYLVYVSALILTETLFTTLLVGSIALMIRGGHGLVVGLLLLATLPLVRPGAAVLVPLLAVAAGFARGATRPHIIRDVTLALVIMFALLAPWMIRNNARLGSPILASTNGGITLYDGFNPLATGGSDQRFVTLMPQLREMSEVERDAYLRRLAVDYITANPGRSLRLIGIKLLRTLSPWPVGSAQAGSFAAVVVGTFFGLPLLLLAGGAVAFGSGALRWRIMMLVPILFVLVSSAATVGSMRYRLPVEPLIATLASSLLVRIAPRSLKDP